MLNVYSASAGSGKTHRLTGEYLKLLFASDAYDGKPYKHILAVTFTNKATEEMKQRILSELYQFSIDASRSPFFEDFKTLDRFRNMDEETLSAVLKKKGRELLYEILNDYSLFNISTIDKFFQQILRAFAREVGQYTSYNVELDQTSVLRESVDQLMEDLDGNEELLKWMIGLSIEAIENGEKWNSRPKIERLGNELFSEEFRSRGKFLQDSMKDKQYILSYRNGLKKIIDDFEGEVRSICRRGMDIIAGHSLDPADFKGGARSPFNYLKKIVDGAMDEPPASLLKLEGQPDLWSAKTAPSSVKASILEAYENGLNRVVADLEETFSRYTTYMTARVILTNLYSMGVLWDIYAYIQDYCKKKNLVLLSETTHFLNRIIDGGDTPFIYEKIGTRINHYMLDEFQDTSVMQWNNFRPLISDSLASGRDNLIVGDVKQSIYRWRSSDWNLLNSRIFEDFDTSMIHQEPLSTNWRSAREIIDFNNRVFPAISQILQHKYNTELEESDQTIVNIYREVKQDLPAHKCAAAGHVHFSFLDECEDRTWKEVALERLMPAVDRLHGNGYEYRDMAVLVRTNSEARAVAEQLLGHGYKVISDESLLISSSDSVDRIVSSLKYMLDPQDRVIGFFIRRGITLPKSTSLYLLCEEIIRSFTAEEQKDAIFINAFLDCVADYVSRNGSDIKGFLNWWDKVGCNRSISAPDGEDAIRIMTIHKSKGLGFNVVLMPFFGEQIYREKGDILWCVPEAEPFSQMGLLPIRSSQILLKTAFAADYRQEKLYSFVDVLNLCYVAFTRAKKELVAFAPAPKLKKDGSYGISRMSDVLYSILENELIDGRYDLGEWSVTLPSGKVESGIVSRNVSDFHSVPVGNRLQLVLTGKDFFDGENDSRGQGVIYHEVLSNVSKEEDLEKAIRLSVSEGLISADEYDGVSAMLSRHLEAIRDRHWFDGTYTHLNEFTVIDKEGNLHRPDRVMIDETSKKAVVVDYKFGKFKQDKYKDQVARYVRLIGDMGYVDVEGYLWYFEDSTIERI